MTVRPLVSRLSECRDCQEPIVFARLDTGKAIPLDPMPNGRGNVAVMMLGGRLSGYVITKERHLERGFTLAMPHAATCPARKGPKPAKSSPESDPALF